MNRRLVLLVMLGVPQLLRAQKPSGALEGMDLFAQAATSLWRWLSSLGTDLDVFVDHEKRGQFAKSLRKLNHALYEVESAKTQLIADIRRSTDKESDKNHLRGVAMQIIGRVEYLKFATRDVAIALRERTREGGIQCERLLSIATGENKFWLYDIANDRVAMGFAKSELLKNAELAVTALHAASVEVAKLTVKLHEK